MNYEDVQKKVTKALGGCWHEKGKRNQYNFGWVCTCGNAPHWKCKNLDLTTWPGFGWMWEQMQKREDFASFVIFVECRFTKHENGYFKEVILNLINPEQFLLVVDVWLQGKRRI